MRIDLIDLLDPVADHDLNVGLVGWWLGLENTAGGAIFYDLLGSLHGSFSGIGQTSTSGWNSGPNDFPYIAFDGTNDYVDLGVATPLEITGDMTVLMSFNTTMSASYREFINAAQGGSPYSGWGFGLGPSGSTMGFWPGAPGNDWSNANTAINDGVWHYGGISISGSTATFYLDGRSDGSFTPGAARNPSGQVKSIGGNAALGRYATVAIGEVRVYNRALSADEVAQLYDQWKVGNTDTLKHLTQATVHVEATATATTTVYRHETDEIDLLDPVADHDLNVGLIGWWLGLENVSGGELLYDLVNGRHGTLTNGPTWGVDQNGFGAVRYDGIDDYVDLNAAQLIGGTSSPFTVEFDCYMEDANSNSLATFNYGGNGLFFGYVNINGTYQGWSLGDNAWQPQQDGRSGLTAGRYHVVFTYNGSGVSSTANYGIYQNAEAGTVANAGAYGLNGAVSRIGYHAGSDDWTGSIYSVRVYDRALSAEEVSKCYDQSLRGYSDTLRRVRRTVFTSYSAGVGGGSVKCPFYFLSYIGGLSC